MTVTDDHRHQRNEDSHSRPGDGVSRLERRVAEQSAGKLVVVDTVAVGLRHNDRYTEPMTGQSLGPVVPEARQIDEERTKPDDDDCDERTTLVDEAARMQGMTDGDVATDRHHHRQPRADHTHTHKHILQSRRLVTDLL